MFYKPHILQKLQPTVAIMAGIFMLNGCGFSPVYQIDKEKTSTQNQLSQIHINSIAEQDGLILYNHLIDVLNPHGRPQNPKYRLISKINVSAQSTAIKRNSEAKRGVITVSGNFQLITDKEEKIFKTKSECGYTIVDSPYATEQASKDAKKRCLKDTGNNIHTQLSLYFRQRIEQESN